MDKLYLIGNGYVANCICENYSELFHLIGVSRSNKENCSENITLDISVKSSQLSNLILSDSNIVYLAPPQKSGNKDRILEVFLSSVQLSRIKRFVYISTSGVYGDKKDAIVNEKSSTNPITDRAKRRADAEQQIINSGLEYLILRVPGIYGKGRLPLKRVKERLPLIKESICKHTNLIHVKDLSKIIINSIKKDDAKNIVLNVSDGCPIKTTTYYKHIYDALNIEYPKFIDYDEAMAIYDDKRKSFINESRILNIDLMKKLFPNAIEFKDIRDGIKDCLS